MVTIIIPTYKRSKYIERAIYSILRQTYKDYEIIVVDDNDPETEDRKRLEEIMKKYENDSRIKYVKHDKNRNGAVARNTGIKIAKGEYITFLDDDDYFLKNRLEVLVAALEENKEYSGVFSSSLVKKEKLFTKVKIASEFKDYIKETLNQISIIGTGSNMFFRAQALKDINGFNEEFFRHQDFELLIRFLENGNKMLGVDEILVVKDNSSRINEPGVEKALEYREKYLKYFEHTIKKYEDYEEIYIKNYKELLLNAVRNKNEELIKIIYERIKTYVVDEKKINEINELIKKEEEKCKVKKNILRKMKWRYKYNRSRKATSDKIKASIAKEKIDEIFEIEKIKSIKV